MRRKKAIIEKCGSTHTAVTAVSCFSRISNINISPRCLRVSWIAVTIIVLFCMYTFAFRSCAKDTYCAARTVENYMARFSRDCTGNGVIDCDDYVRIHQFGASGCTNTLHNIYENIYKLCIQTVGEH